MAGYINSMTPGEAFSCRRMCYGPGPECNTFTDAWCEVNPEKTECRTKYAKQVVRAICTTRPNTNPDFTDRDYPTYDVKRIKVAYPVEHPTIVWPKDVLNVNIWDQEHKKYINSF